MSDRLGGAVGRKPLHFFFVLDVSGSMARGGRIQALNNAIREVTPHLRDEAALNPHAQLMVRVMTFATEIEWVVPDPTPIEQFRWRGVQAVQGGFTELGLALRELAAMMRQLAEEARGFPPAIVLVSDGRPTRVNGPPYTEGLAELLAEPWGKASVRMALGVGRDADISALKRFVGRDDVPLPRADNPQQLADLIVWASKAASRVSSQPVVGPKRGVSYHQPVSLGDPVWSRTEP